jgi:hypothetical protein
MCRTALGTENGALNTVGLPCISDDAQREALEVVWDAEVRPGDDRRRRLVKRRLRRPAAGPIMQAWADHLGGKGADAVVTPFRARG